MDCSISFVVHDSIVKHEQYISLKFVCGPNFFIFNILFNGLKILWSGSKKKKKKKKSKQK